MEAKVIEIRGEDLLDIKEKLERMRDEMDSIIEELEILMDKELMESIKRGEENIEKGEIYSFDDFKKMVKE